MAKFSGIAQGRIEHGEGVDANGTPVVHEYRHGETFETDDEALWNALRSANAVKLQGEIALSEEQAAAALNAAQQQAAELEMARNRIAELEALVRSQSENKAPGKKLPE